MVPADSSGPLLHFPTCLRRPGASPDVFWEIFRVGMEYLRLPHVASIDLLMGLKTPVRGEFP